MRVVDVMKRIASLKWNWAGHIARITDEDWTKTIMDWIPPTKKLVGDHQSEGPIALRAQIGENKSNMVTCRNSV